MPTEKRQRQKQGRQARLEAKRKEQKRRQLLRRGAIVVIVAGVVVGSVLLFTQHSSTPTSSTTTTTTLPVHQVTPAEIAAITLQNKRITKIVLAQQMLTASAAQRSTAQTQANNAAVAAGCPASPSARVNTQTWTTPPKMTISTSATYRAVFKTTTGSFTVRLDAKGTPITVNNFVFLARHGYYKCVTFHRVIPYFMNQSGDPTGTGSGSPGYTIPDENPAKASNPSYQYPPGSLAMANTGAPNSGGGQFFIVTGATGESLPNTYALFGQVSSGLPVVAKINGQGNGGIHANGQPPLVVQRIISVTILGPAG